MHSAIVEGRFKHRRHAPIGHEFSYGLFMVWLDLSELDSVFQNRWFWSTRNPALARFRRSDHLGDPSVPLEHSVRDLVEGRGVERPTGPVRAGSPRG